MKVVYIYGNIINCEEIRNAMIVHSIIKLYFKNSDEYMTIECQSEEDAKDVMDIIYNEMIRE